MHTIKSVDRKISGEGGQRKKDQKLTKDRK